MLVATIPGKQAGIADPIASPEFDVTLAPESQRAIAS
jgi:hypothetical protein